MLADCSRKRKFHPLDILFAPPRFVFRNAISPLINASRHIRTPNWKLIQILKSKKGLQADGRTYYTDTRGIWTSGLQPHALPAITGHIFFCQKAVWTTRKRYIQTERNISSTGTHWGTPDPSLGDKFIAGLGYHTGNEYKYKNPKRPAEKRIDRRDISANKCIATC